MNRSKTFIFYLLAISLAYFCLGERFGLAKGTKGRTINTAIWWECATVELNISGTTILIDPFFPFYRKTNVILITHSHGDHCHIPTIKKVIEVSGDELGLIVGSKQCEKQFNEFIIPQENLADRWEVIMHKGLTIVTVPSYEGVTDIGYIIRDPRTGLNILHMGDNTRFSEDFSRISDIDYLFLSMGKMSYEDMIRFIKTINPKYLIPIHYKPTKGTFLIDEYNYSYPSPDEPEKYIDDLKNKIQENKIKTEVLILYPGEVKELNHN